MVQDNPNGSTDQKETSVMADNLSTSGAEDAPVQQGFCSISLASVLLVWLSEARPVFPPLPLEDRLHGFKGSWFIFTLHITR